MKCDCGMVFRLIKGARSDPKDHALLLRGFSLFVLCRAKCTNVVLLFDGTHFFEKLSYGWGVMDYN